LPQHEVFFVDQLAQDSIHGRTLFTWAGLDDQEITNEVIGMCG